MGECLTSRLFPPIFDPKSALPTLKSPWSLSRISFTTSSRACYRKKQKTKPKHKIFLDITNTAAEILYTNTEAFQFLVEDWRHKMCKIECKQKSQRRTLGLRVRPALCEDPQWFSGACLLRWAWGHPESLSSALLFSPGRKQSERGQSHSETPGAKRTVHSERQNFRHFLINRLDFLFF